MSNVIVEGDRVPIPEGMTHARLAFDRGEEPEPEPAPVFPRGGWLGFEFVSQPEGFWPWAQEHGAIGCRFPTIYWHNDPARGRGFPAIVHLGPSKDSDQKVKDALARRYEAYPATFGVHLWDERARTAKTSFWYDYIRAAYPAWRVFWGPFQWTWLHEHWYYDDFDGVIAYQNCTRRTRTTLDWTLHLALKNYYKRPVAFSLNPLDNSEAMLLAEGLQYARALGGVVQAFDAVFVWRATSLWAIERGAAPQCPNPDELPIIQGALAAVGVKQGLQKTPRPSLPVRFVESGTEEGPPHKVDHTLALARCRVAWKAGRNPVASSEPDACDPLAPSAGTDYGSALRHMANWTDWTASAQAFVEEYEDSLAVQLREKLE